MDHCTFCEIASGKQTAHKVYEDADVIAFLDIQPLRAGHLLVIPRRHFQRITDLPDELSAALGSVLPRLGRAMCLAVNQPDWTLLSNQGYRQVVPHVHYHLIPAPHLGDFSKPFKNGPFLSPREELDDDDGERLAARMRERLAREGHQPRSKL